MPRYDDDDDDDRPRRRSQRRYDDDDEDEDDDDSGISRKPGGPQGNGFAMASMILGIVGFCVPLICGLLAMLFGVLGLGRAKVTGTGKGMAITGIILGFLNGIIEPSAIGYGIYYAGKKAKQAADKLEAEIQAEQKRREDENKAWQKKLEDDRRERERKQAEDQKKWEEDQKIAAAKRKEEEEQRKARDAELAKKREEDRIQREMEAKERMAKFEEERKKREEESKLNADIAKARQEIFALENAVRAYTIRNKNKPPATLQALLTSPNGGPGLINANTSLKDPWGKDYQYDAANKNLVGGIDPMVFTLHPKTGEKILAFNRK
jgi:hypothetical protein